MGLAVDAYLDFVRHATSHRGEINDRSATRLPRKRRRLGLPAGLSKSVGHRDIAVPGAIADNGAIQLPGAGGHKIDIYDQSYNVSTDQLEEYLRELAAYVDGKMREVRTRRASWIR